MFYYAYVSLYIVGRGIVYHLDQCFVGEMESLGNIGSCPSCMIPCVWFYSCNCPATIPPLAMQPGRITTVCETSFHFHSRVCKSHDLMTDQISTRTIQWFNRRRRRPASPSVCIERGRVSANGRTSRQGGDCRPLASFKSLVKNSQERA